MRALVGVAVAGLLLLTACGADDGGASSAAPSSQSASAPASRPATSAATSPASGASSSPSAGSPSASGASTARPSSAAGGSPRTKEAAIQRYEVYMHAVGREDLKTVCEIAAPAMKKAEDEGFGPCESTAPITFQMISPAQKKALLTATIDPGHVAMSGGGQEANIPALAIQASVTFTESDMGDAVLDYRNGDWYVID